MPTRRQLFRTAAVAAASSMLPLPWLEAGDTPAAVPPARPAARCVFIHIPYGTNAWRWFPKAFGPGCDLGPTLAPLQPFAKRLTVFSGLHLKGAGGHGDASGYLTGRAVGKRLLSGHTISIDQRIAASRGHETGLPSLQLSVSGGQDSPSYDAKGTAMYGLCDLRMIYEKLFGSPAAVARTRRHQSILDALRPRLGQLDSNLGREDHRRLSQFTDSIASVDAQLVRDRAYYLTGAESITTTAPGLTLDANKLDFIGRDSYIDTMYQLLGLALHSDRTRILSFECPFSQGAPVFTNFPSLVPGGGANSGWHGNGHATSSEDEGKNPQAAAFMANVDRYWAGHVARFLARLDAIPHHGETLLDHTVVMYGYGMTWGNHMPGHLPVLIAGGNALGLRHQGHIGYNERSPAGVRLPPSNFSDLLRTISEVCGVPAPGFGDSTRLLREVMA